MTETSSSETDSAPSSELASKEPTYLCCDLTARIKRDISILRCDVSFLTEKKKFLFVIQRAFEGLCSDVRQKLNILPSFKRKFCPNVDLHEVHETRDFLKYAWSLSNSTFTGKAKKQRFISSKGITAQRYVTELTSAVNLIATHFNRNFFHQECLACFQHLSNEMSLMIVPEIMKGDQVIIGISYIYLTGQALKEFLNMLDIYIVNPTMVGINDVTRHFLSPGSYQVPDTPCEARAMQEVASLLRGNLLGIDPIVDTDPVVHWRNDQFFSKAAELACYLTMWVGSVPLRLREAPAYYGHGLLEVINTLRSNDSLKPKAQSSTEAPRSPSKADPAPSEASPSSPEAAATEVDPAETPGPSGLQLTTREEQNSNEDGPPRRHSKLF